MRKFLSFIISLLFCLTLQAQDNKIITWDWFQGSNYDYQGFVYGNLENDYPSLSYNQLDSIRSNNFDRLKSILITGAAYNMPPLRLEISIPEGETISNETIKIYGANESLSQIVVWPFVPEAQSTDEFFLITSRYGDRHSIRNVTIKSPQKAFLFETYNCILKEGGNARRIEITDTPRPGFWSGLTVNKKVWYSWSISILGELKQIASIDSLNGYIIVNSDITGTIASNTPGTFGTDFPQDINEVEYIANGEGWFISKSNIKLISGVPLATSGDDYILNLTNTTLENTPTLVTLSMGTAKVNFQNVSINSSEVGFSFFSRSYAGGQQVTINDTLTVFDNGYYLAGSITALDASGIYGAGGYLHDNIIVDCQGVLNLVDNTASSWRQYSSSYSPVNVGTNYYSNIQETGSGEYCFLTSNVTPTIIETINCESNILARHNTIINNGTIGYLLAYNLDFGIGDIYCDLNNLTITEGVNGEFFDSLTIDNSNIQIGLLTDKSTSIYSANTTIINNCNVIKKASVGTWNPSNGTTTGSRGSNFIYLGFDTRITNLYVDSYIYSFMFDNSTPQTPYTELQYSDSVNNSDLKFYALWLQAIGNTAGSISKIFYGENNIIRNNFTGNGSGKYYPQSLQGLESDSTISLTASKAYSIAGTLTDVLQIDWNNDTYRTSGTIRSIVVSNNYANSYISNPIWSKPITLIATGGNIDLVAFNSVSNNTGNLIGVNTTILQGDSLVLQPDNDFVFMTGTAPITTTIATGTGLLSTYKGVLPNYILDPTVLVNVTAGAIDVDSNADGVFSNGDVVGVVDYWTGLYQFNFTAPVGLGVDIDVTYNIPNVWKNTGGFVIP